jgi:hypothetical protein
MRLFSIVAVVGLAAGALAAYFAADRGTPARSGEFVSGPQVGSKIPGAFEPLNINGPDAGDEACLFCRFGNSPTVMVFATKPTEGVAAFTRQVEKAAAVATKAGNEVGACVVVTDPGEETRKELARLADKENLKNVILGVIEGRKLKAYELHPDAEVTVLLYDKRVVRVNRAFKAGEFTEKAVGELVPEVTKLYATK